MLADGGDDPVGRAVLLAPLEQALRAMSWAVVLVRGRLAVDPVALGAASIAAAEPGDRHLDHTVMPPLQQRTADPAGEPHGRLAASRPSTPPQPGAVSLGPESEPRVPDQVPADGRVDGVRALAVDELDPDSHPVRKRRGDDAVEHRTRGQARHPRSGIR